MAMRYPPAWAGEQVDEYFGTKVADPYRWMEDVDSAEVKAWVDAENALTQEWLKDVPARGRIHARLMELNDFERFSAPGRDGNRYFYRRNSGLENQASLYWQEGLEGEPKVLLNPNTLRADGTVALESYSVCDDGTLLAYALAEAGSDVQRVHVKTVATGEDLADVVDYVKFSGVSWLKDGSGFFYSSFGVPKTEEEKAEVLKHAAVFHKVYFHRLGTEQSADAVVFERPDDKEMLCNAGVSEDGCWLMLYQTKGNFNQLAVRDLTEPGWEKADAALVWVAKVDDASYDPGGVIGHELWLKTTKDAPNGKIVRVNLQRPEPEHWTAVVAETANLLDGASLIGNGLVLTYLVDAKSEVEWRGLDGTLKQRVPLPGIGSVAVHGGRRRDEEAFFTFTNYTTPATVYRLDLKTLHSRVWKQPKLTFDPALYETRLEFAVSKDGADGEEVRVPLFVTAKKGLAMDGTDPALLYG